MSGRDPQGDTVILCRIHQQLWRKHRTEIVALEIDLYEPSRRDDMAYLESMAIAHRGVSILALENDTVVGWTLGAPLEMFTGINGVDQDPHRGRHDTLYCGDTLVARSWQGKGLARRLKTTQVKMARQLGYKRMTGRNRVGLADAMWAINQSLGASPHAILENDYDDNIEPNRCIYYELLLD